MSDIEREEFEPVATINAAHCFDVEDASRLMRLPAGTKLYTHPASAQKEIERWKLVAHDQAETISELQGLVHANHHQQAVSVPDVLYDSYAVLQEVRRVRSKSESEEVISLQMTVSDVLDAAVKLIKQEQDDDQ